MKILQHLLTAAAFLVCTWIGAAGGLLTDMLVFSPLSSSGPGLIIAPGSGVDLLVGTGIGMMLGVAGAVQVWRVFDRRAASPSRLCPMDGDDLRVLDREAA